MRHQGSRQPLSTVRADPGQGCEAGRTDTVHSGKGCQWHSGQTKLDIKRMRNGVGYLDSHRLPVSFVGMSGR